MELNWIQIGVVGGLGVIVGLVLAYLFIIPLRTKKSPLKGNFKEIHASIKEAEENLNQAQETLNNLATIFEEVSNGKKDKPIKRYDDEPKFE